MPRGDRTGKRQGRSQRIPSRVHNMGYYLVVTDTEATERCYFNGLYDSLPDEIKKKLVIKVVETKTKNLVEKCKELMAYEPQYRILWIVFDRDKVKDFDQIIKAAKIEGINVGWSNPCFEIWLFGYFGKIPSIAESWICCNQFGDEYKKQTGQKYSKSEKDLYKKLCDFGDEDIALKLAKQKYEQLLKDGMFIPSEMCPCTTVYELVGEIKAKINRTR